MIQPAGICQTLFTRWRMSPALKELIPGGLWLAGTVPAEAVAPYASFSVEESETENGSNYTIRRFDVSVSVWSDNAAANASTISNALNNWLPVDYSTNPLVLQGGRVIQVRPGQSSQEIEDAPRAASDVTVMKINRRIVTEEKHGR